MEDLLKLLDLPDEKLIRKLYELGYTDYFVKLHCGRDGVTYECKTGSLADLAFRLDKGDFNLYIEALEIVYKHWIEKQEERPCLITFTCWLAVYITAQDRIVAALRARRLAGER